MSERSRHVTSSDGRHRVAYEMAADMWFQSKSQAPTLEDKEEFLELVRDCTKALTWRDG